MRDSIQSMRLASLYGQAFEVSVKSGIVSRLRHAGLDAATLKAWDEISLDDVVDAFVEHAESAGVVDELMRERCVSTLRHLHIVGRGLGDTLIRELLERRGVDASSHEIRRIRCPIDLPGCEERHPHDAMAALGAFSRDWAVEPDEMLLRKGRAARVDFALWLTPKFADDKPLLTVLEISLNALIDAEDYAKPDPHLQEIMTFASRIVARSVFSSVKAEIAGGEGFALAPDIRRALLAFTSKDKPFYKLCQACSYLWSLVEILPEHESVREFDAVAIALTKDGIESISAAFGGTSCDPKQDLVRDLGVLYRDASRVDADPDGIAGLVLDAAETIRRSLPLRLRRSFPSFENIEIGQNLDVEASETLYADDAHDIADLEYHQKFCNPTRLFSRAEVRELVGNDEAVTEFLGRPAVEIAEEAFGRADGLELRALHGAFVEAGMEAAKKGEVTVLGLEGNPGIGKTFSASRAILRSVRKGEGVLFIYVSPRVVINDDVAKNLAEKGADTILCLGTNSRLISGAPLWWSQTRKGKGKVDAAVCYAGIAGFNHPTGPCLYLTPEEKAQAETQHSGPGMIKTQEAQGRYRVEDRASPAVLKTLGLAARMALEVNPDVKGLALTAAMQGITASGTLRGLSSIFRETNRPKAALEERRRFAERFPRVVFMIDEITGDGSGAHFVLEARKFLDEQFIRPFVDEGVVSPFACVLIAADASLSNETVLSRYLGNHKGSPDKVLVSPSRGGKPFDIARARLEFGGRSVDAFHVMTNSFPASRLSIRYRIKLERLDETEDSTGRQKAVRELVSEQKRDSTLRSLRHEIHRAVVDHGSQQTIVFVQDKAFLRDLQALVAIGEEGLPGFIELGACAIIDNNTEPAERMAIVDAPDRYKVVLMTSSGARGISFPKCDHIIVLMPRFQPESALMEIAQVVYRGRGSGGDRAERELTILVEDYAVGGGWLDPESARRWLRRVSDLMTMACLVRATLLTRITGDSGFEGRRVAVVPVGKIQLERRASTMSEQVRQLMIELDSLKRDQRVSARVRSAAGAAQRSVGVVFRNLRIYLRKDDRAPLSLMHDGFAADMRRQWSRPGASIVSGDVLPNGIFVPGAIALERLQRAAGPRGEEKGAFDEEMTFEAWDEETSKAISILMGNLRLLREDRSLPGRLRHTAKAVIDIVQRAKSEENEGRFEYASVKDLGHGPNTWVVLPADRAAFTLVDEDGRRHSLSGLDQDWNSALAAAAGERKPLPVIPLYRNFPFVISLDSVDPMNFEGIFDARYLAATNEFNLLNLLMLSKMK